MAIPLGPSLAKFKVPTPLQPLVPKQNVQQFTTEIARQTGNPIDPGIQSRMQQPQQTAQIAAQQQAFQGKLKELGDWSKGITQMQRASRNKMVDRQAKSAVLNTQSALRGNGVTPVSRTVGGSASISPSGWGNFRNGQIPPNALTGLSFARGQALERNAAKGLEAMNAAYRQATGRNIGITDSYRSLGGQQALAKTKPGLAAQPGTSVHGWGKALDLNVKGDPQLKAWLDKNGPKFGFNNPAWARSTDRYEPWHWEYTG